MLRAVTDPSLDEILAQVSRSFYLSMAVLPKAVRTQISIAYLVARAADTIADTRAVRAERRRELLSGLRAALTDGARAERLAVELRAEIAGEGGAAEAERRLLMRFGECLAGLARQPEADRARTRRVLDHLITGMERDLARFDAHPSGVRELRPLASMEELDEHTYLAAGCVGEYWTEMTAAHLPVVAHFGARELLDRAVHLGKALQLVNVIRDAPADLAAGRCYVPRPLLEVHGLQPADLVGPERRRARPLLDELRHLALEHVDAAWPYVMAIPPRAPRLRLACIWPLWIGLATLEKIALADDPLDPSVRIKVTRRELYRLIAESVAAVALNPVLTRRHWKRRARAGHHAR
jgi:farnesyl-diphosphate farnesyltransferase